VANDQFLWTAANAFDLIRDAELSWFVVRCSV